MELSINEKEFDLIMRGLEMLLGHTVFKGKEYNEVERLYDSLKEQKEEYDISVYTPCNDIELQHKH